MNVEDRTLLEYYSSVRDILDSELTHRKISGRKGVIDSGTKDMTDESVAEEAQLYRDRIEAILAPYDHEEEV